MKKFASIILTVILIAAMMTVFGITVSADVTSANSILSEGNLLITITIAVVAAGVIAALIIVKRKNKPTDTADKESKDEE